MLRMPPVRDEAVCLRRWEWSETSQSVLLFGRASGAIRALAKGARRHRAPFSGGIEPVTRGEVELIPPRGDAMATLIRWDLLETFDHLRRRLSAYYVASYAADMVRHAVTDHDPHPTLYDALVRLLRAVDTDSAGAFRALVRFQWQLLTDIGYRPELRHAVDAGTPVRPARTYRFSPALGGLVAASGRIPRRAPVSPARPTSRRDAARPASDRRDGSGELWPVRAATIELLRAIADGADDAVDTVDVTTLLRAVRLLHAYLCHLLGRELPSAQLVFSLPLESPPDAGIG